MKEAGLKDIEEQLPSWENGVVRNVPGGCEKVGSSLLKEGDNLWREAEVEDC